MFTTVSMTGSGLLTIALGTVLGWLGVNAEASQLAGWVDAIVKLAGLIMLVIGQLRRKDLSWGFWRK